MEHKGSPRTPELSPNNMWRKLKHVLKTVGSRTWDIINAFFSATTMQMWKSLAEDLIFHDMHP